jgi:hypothetical protein
LGGDTDPKVAELVDLLRVLVPGGMLVTLPSWLVADVPCGLVRVPVADAPPGRLVLAWREQDHRPLVASFVSAVLGSTGGETDGETEGNSGTRSQGTMS